MSTYPYPGTTGGYFQHNLVMLSVIIGIAKSVTWVPSPIEVS